MAKGRRRRGKGSSGGFATAQPDNSDAQPYDIGDGRGGPDADPEAVARTICLRLLTAAPRTRAQLADALRRRGVPDEAAQAVLDRFGETSLIDDEAFADAWVQSRHRGKGLARRALAHELRRRGVAEETVDEAVEQVDRDQELRTARELVAKRLPSTHGLEPAARMRRLAGMLARKGYPASTAYRVVREALDSVGDDTEGLQEFE